MNTFRSELHTMYTELKNKVALSYADDKRFIIAGERQTLAWGHKRIIKILCLCELIDNYVTITISCVVYIKVVMLFLLFKSV